MFINQEVLDKLIEMLESNNIPLLKLPSDAIERIIQNDDSFFSTFLELDYFANFYDLETMEETFNELETFEKMNRYNHLTVMEKPFIDDNNSVYLFACGISGYGVQNWSFKYFLITPTIRMAITIPYGNAYSNPEDEKDELDTAIKLIEFVQNNLLEENKKLSFILNSNIFSYGIKNSNNEIIEQGNEIDKMLDAFVKQSNSEVENCNNWIKV